MSIQSDKSQMLLWGGVAFALLWGLLLLGPVLTPFVAGAILAYILKPGVEWPRGHRCPRGVAAALVIVLVILPAILTRLNEQFAPRLKDWFGVTIQLDAQLIHQFLSEHWQTIFALLASGQVFGFVGVLLALPASAVLLVALRRVWTLYFTSGFYRIVK